MLRLIKLCFLIGVILTIITCNKKDELPCGPPTDYRISGKDSVIWELIESEVISHDALGSDPSSVVISNPTENNRICFYRNKTYKTTDTVAKLLGIKTSGNWSNIVGDADWRNDALTIDTLKFPLPDWCNSGFRFDNRESLDFNRYANKWTDSSITFWYTFLKVNRQQ